MDNRRQGASSIAYNGLQQGKRSHQSRWDRQEHAGVSSAKRPRAQNQYMQGSPSGYRQGHSSTWENSGHGFLNDQQSSLRNKADDMTKATEYILQIYSQKKQTLDTFQRKMHLRNALFTIVEGLAPSCGLYIVGSSMSGFGTVFSDMDMCLHVAPNMIIPKKEAVEWLKLVQRALRKCAFLREIQFIGAKVPIIKFKDRISGVECDINVNNEIGIRNTHLLNAYAKLDIRVKPLVLFVKLWAKYHNINDASQSTLSSYSLTMMVLHFLQCGCKPPVVPSLQRMHPQIFDKKIEVKDLSLQQEIPSYTSPNKQPVGELYVGFLNYYCVVFNFRKDAMSVRLAQKLTIDTVQRGNASTENQWKFICIEEPFDLSNIARSVHNIHKFQRICHVFQASLRIYRQTGSVQAITQNPL